MCLFLIGFLSCLWGCGQENQTQGKVTLKPEHVVQALLSLPPKALPLEGEVQFFEKRLQENGEKDVLAHTRLFSAELARFKATLNWTHFKAATAHWKSLQTLQPGAEATWAAKIELDLAVHRFDSALASARHALQGMDGNGNKDSLPEGEGISLTLFDAFFAHGDLVQADSVLKAYSGNHRGFAYLTRQARWNGVKGNNEKALVLLNQARQQALDFAQAPHVLAWCEVERAHLLTKLGRIDEARDADFAALSHRSGYAPALEDLASIALGDGMFAEAASLYHHALRCGGPLSLYNSWIASEEAQQHAKIADSLRSVFFDSARISAGVERLYWRPLALLFLQSQETLSIAEAFARLDAANRPTPESHDVLFLAYHRQGMRDKDSLAYTTIHKALKAYASLNGSTPPADLYRHAALAAWKLNRKDEARAWLDSSGIRTAMNSATMDAFEGDALRRSLSFHSH